LKLNPEVVATEEARQNVDHLSPGYIADTVRATFGTLGIVEPSNVVPIALGPSCGNSTSSVRPAD
jgi:hypothetical protein